MFAKGSEPLSIGSGIQSATFQRSRVASLSRTLWNDVLIKYWERGFHLRSMFHTKNISFHKEIFQNFIFAKNKTNKIVKFSDKTLFATKIET